jgi:O-antigen/teichoic acid export membrane protein
MRTKQSLLNIIFSLINKVSVVIFGFVLVKLVLVTYGSAYNGMFASIRQFIRYLSLLEMGIAGASIYALYKPLADGNDVKISNILGEAKRYYFKSGIAFTIGSLVLAVAYPFLIKNSNIPDMTAFLIFLILTVSTALDFFAFAKYRVIFTADQKEYILSICNTIHLATYSILAILAIQQGMSVITMQLTVIIGYLARFVTLYYLYNWIYKDRFDLSLRSNNSFVKHKNKVMWHEISWLIIFSTPVIVMTLFYSLEQVSVYAVYNMVVSNVIILISVFNTSFTSGFGEILSMKKYKLFTEVFHQFEFMYYSLSGVIFLCVLQLIQPFIQIYTNSVTDYEYDNPVIVKMMIIFALANSFRIPSNTVIGVTGSFKITMSSAILAAFLCIVISVASAFVGFEYIIVGSTIAFIIRGAANMIIANKLSIGYVLETSLINIIVSICIFLIVYFITGGLVNHQASSYLEYFLNAGFVTSINICIYVALMYVFNKNITLQIIKTVTRIGKFI